MKNKKHLSRAMLFILLFGIVSLFSDMTHEGAASIRGADLSLLGASAGVIGFVSGALTLILLLITRSKFPNPEQFEPEPKEYIPFRLEKKFKLYMTGISLFAFGFIDYSLVIMHVSRHFTDLAGKLSETSALVNSGTLPLLYAGAMLVDAVAALVFGLLYDKKGVRALAWSTLLSAPFAIFVFVFDSVPALLLGVALWGVGMGAQESILKAQVTKLVPKLRWVFSYSSWILPELE